MHHQKTPLRFEIKLLPVALDSHPSIQRNKTRRCMLRRAKRHQTSSVEIYAYDLNAPTANVEAATPATRSCNKARTRARTIMEMLGKQTPAASSEMVKLIRKLHWVGSEEKAEQLEKKLEQQPANDTVLAIQSETD
jgi:hypothetical protein